jgi:copper chaperone CopZ
MHCRSCAGNVADSVEELEGAQEVAVDLETGRLRVAGGVDEAAVLEAVAAAGYSAQRVA